MPVSRSDLAGAGTPEALVKRILQAEPDLPVPVLIEEPCERLGILRIENLDNNAFEGGLITDAKRSEGTILAKPAGEPRRNPGKRPEHRLLTAFVFKRAFSADFSTAFAPTPRAKLD